jgi:hypothetical protein
MKTYKLTVAAVLALTLIAVTTMTLGAAPTDKWYLVYSGENAPILPNKNLKAHSDEWNNYYFDRNVNTRIVPSQTEYLEPGLRRGGMAIGARMSGIWLASDDLRPMRIKVRYV